MEDKVEMLGMESPEIRAVVERLIQLLRPDTVYLYNQRVGAAGETSGFKLCVVARMEDKHQAEMKAYLEIDCEVPFDLLLYTPEEWAEIAARKDSFASKIIRNGTVVYG